MTESENRKIISLARREVVSVISCAEPILVFIYIAKVTETLSSLLNRISAYLNPDILKTMDLGNPRTEMI